MMVEIGNLFTTRAERLTQEVFEELLVGGAFKLERIVSTGHVTPEGEWYDQESDEWVVLLAGAARLRFEGREREIELHPGDYVNIPAHYRHRVEWTDPMRATVWLALHHRAGAPTLQAR